ncbi:hypothetical protein EZH22_04430 [Xanthobacter dioxanivorans]|uniref:DUF4239 domain-containing protein n=1 Tax=Xanthobacter dioxanivorans TaxID=2528964 RepID=A0A974PQ24_9HYPH|nr:hypothetical protein [Xanthobacter dioxanivorans]QRG07648.1 hypothetical protein EZH22_04430 [Xanthobacter dioxanivorans]
MDALIVAVLVFLGLFGGACAGMWGARRLKEHHLSKETQEAVKLGVGMVAAMASLILGLMTASVKGNFDSTAKDVQQYATYLITLDVALRHYGPDAVPIRAALGDYTRNAIAETWPDSGMPPKIGSADSEQRLSEVGHLIRALEPRTTDQTELRGEAIERYKSLAALRWVLIEESATQVPPVFIGVIIVWLTLIFLSFGLFAPINGVSLVVFLLCGVSLGGAIFLILEMSTPFDGIIIVAPDAMRKALLHIAG